MRNELEKSFGDNLHQLVGNLIKNAVRIPEAMLKSALAFEKHTWHDLPDNEKRSLVAKIAEESDPPSPIHRHFDAYPHPFSRELYARFSSALRHYKESLGL